jgi:hypothetical protein
MPLSPKSLTAYVRAAKAQGLVVTSIKSLGKDVELTFAPAEPEPTTKPASDVDPELVELLNDPIAKRILARG